MAKRKARHGGKSTVPGRIRGGARRPRRRPTAKARAKSRRLTRKARKAHPLRKSQRKTALLRSKAARRKSSPTARRSGKTPRLDRVRRTLADIVPTPPSSLNLDRRGSAVRTGRAGLQDRLEEHVGMTPALTGGDIDADWENAYFSGDEAPGGDNPTPDQDIVEEIGKSLGVEYQDNEELKGSEKVVERDKHRWELDPASSEDYEERK